MKAIKQKCVRLLLSCIFFSGLFTFQAAGNVIKLIPPEGWKGGGGEGSSTQSRVMLPAVSASIEGSLLYIQCANPTMDVTVCIIRNGVIVYDEIIPAAETGYIWIDLSGYAGGVYTLDLTNSSGGHVFGDFELE